MYFTVTLFYKMCSKYILIPNDYYGSKLILFLARNMSCPHPHSSETLKLLIKHCVHIVVFWVMVPVMYSHTRRPSSGMTATDVNVYFSEESVPTHQTS